MLARSLALAVVAVSTAAHAQPVADAAENEDDETFTTGVLALARIDGERRGAAVGLGATVVVMQDLDVEVAALRSNQWGGYVGARLRLLSGTWRPYIAAGLPLFLYDDENDAMTTKLATGLRAAAGIDVVVNEHLSAFIDVGVEYFFRLDSAALIEGKHPDRTLFVPSIGVIGRL